MDKSLVQKSYPEVGKVLATLVENDAHTAVKFISEKFVVRMTRKLIDGKLPAKNQNLEISLVIGRPNYEQREFLKACKKAGEPIPVKKIQLRFPPKKRK